jgi:predicted phage terminase large subunit-like protein
MTKDEKIKKLFYFELLRRNFWEFCLFYDKEFFSNRLFLKKIADGFQKIEKQEITSLSVSMPPRAGKSYITSLFSAWVLGRNPTESVMRNTCTATLYLKFSYDVRNIVKAPKFKNVFPKVYLSETKANLLGWNTNQSRQVGYFGAGVGGTIIGFGATKLAITDDLYRGVEDALSDNTNDKILLWKEATHDSRLEKNCSKIDIGTRWSTNDVIGRNMEEGRYELSIVIPALDEKDETFCDDVMTTEQYHDIRSRINPDIWLAEYMQEPVDMKGRLFSNLIKMPKHEFADIKDKIEGYIGYIDVADQGKDFTAMAIGGIIGEDVYVVDYVFTRDNTDISMPLCSDKLNKWGVKYCRVESNSMGAMFSRQLDKMTNAQILQVHNTKNKITRIIMESAFVFNNFHFIENNTQEYYQFIQNIETFSKEGKNKNDDAPDCIAGLSMFIKGLFSHKFKDY